MSMYRYGMIYEKIKRFLSSEYEQEQPSKHQDLPVVKEKKDIFANISGLETELEVLKQILHASNPVSTVIHSLPGLAKTAIAKAIYNEYKNRSIYIDGNYVTKAGLVDDLVLKRSDKTILLIIDEIEKADKPVLKMLLNIIEGGDIIKTTKTEKIRFKQKVALIGTCNDYDSLKKMVPALVDRIQPIHISKPTPEQFLRIAVFRLARENIDSITAAHIGQLVLDNWGPDMRQVVRIANLSSGHDVERTVANLKKVSAE